MSIIFIHFRSSETRFTILSCPFYIQGMEVIAYTDIDVAKRKGVRDACITMADA
ncbi:hypothetical protein Cni_G07643 [Canna indica]|uniref:Uncharacterized protein n=1 Tax=Canna indica TaxID=4628 RepID=A0AAQ3JZE5_9LILI|nr:hypothetical protein Cni_G07643 [Canna indica]